MKKIILFLLIIFTASIAHARYVDITWDAVAGATSYRLYWGPTSGGPYPYSITDDSITTNSYDQLPINEETTYFVVTAVDGDGEGAASSEITIVDPNAPLKQDGYPTPEQISIFVSRSYSATASATMRYRKVGVDSWTTGHNLYQRDPNGTPYFPGFAWTIFDLDVGSDYVVEVTVTDGGTTNVYTKIMSTATLPADAGAPTINITSSMNTSQIASAINGASPGDVIEFADGNYTIDGLVITVDGTIEAPIYIRGESRDGVVLHDSDGSVLYFNAAKNLVVENMTIQGSGTDGYVTAGSVGISYQDTGTSYVANAGNVTFRYLTMTGVDKGIITTDFSKQLFVYECILRGNNTFDQDLWGWYPIDPEQPDGTPDIDDNSMWNDDGVRLYGYGNAAWNNTLYGFGDAFSAGSGANYSNSVHFYRNKVMFTGDDASELDDSNRNISFYDNYVQNVMTMIGIDYNGNASANGGPYFAFRNIGINIVRQMVKINADQYGYFIWNNTAILTYNENLKNHDWGYYESGAYIHDYWAFQNNILIYHTTSGKTFLMEFNSGNDNIDFTNNSWYPNNYFQWTRSGGTFTNLANAYAGLYRTNPVFSSETKRHENDLISELQPFETEIVMPAESHTEVTTVYIPTLDNESVNKNSGVAIVGITDGFTGAAPDRGALIAGIGFPTVGATIETESSVPTSRSPISAKTMAKGVGTLEVTK